MKNNILVGDIYWGIAFIFIGVLLLSPFTNPVYEAMNSMHPFLTGFLKFMVLASMGELIAQRISTKEWSKTKGFLTKAIIWGLIGILITFMFNLYPLGIQGLIDRKLIPSTNGFLGKVTFGFYTSLVVNLSFGPIFMALHRISDTLIDAKVDKEKLTLMQAIEKIKWGEFIRFVVGKTIPYFWIPAHTITFLLSENYRILFAAFLSIALGVILTVAKNEKEIIQ